MARAISSLPGTAFAGDEHREVVPLQPLDLLDDARHGGAGREEPGQQRLERSIDGDAGHRQRRAIARRAQREALARDRRNHPQPPHDRVTDRPWRRDEAEAQAVGVAAERLDDERAAARRVCPGRADRAMARAASSSQPATAMTRMSPTASCEDDGRCSRPRRPRAVPARSRARAGRAAPPHPRFAARWHRRRRPAR